MKATKLYRIGILTLGLMLTLTACIDVTGPERGRGESVPEGMGLARIHLGGGGARTVAGGIEGLYFTLDFTAPEKTPVNRTLDSGMSLTVALEPAVWTLTVNGYTDSSKVVHRVRGSASISVIAGTESSFEVYLAGDFSSGGTGSLSYSFGLPTTVSRAWFGLYPLDVPEGSSGTIAAGTWEQDISSFAGVTVSDTLTGLPEGAYLAVVDLYDGGNNKAAVWTRAVHIDDGSPLSLAHSFTAGDFAECDPVVGVGESTLADKLDAALGSPSGAYTIVLDGGESDLTSFTPKTLTVMGEKSITVIIRGNGHEVQLGGNGSLFTVTVEGVFGSSLKLVLQDVTLRGLGSNDDSLVRVEDGGTLEMKAGSLITGNTNTIPYGYGGGVFVSYGTFSMSGGMVSANTVSSSDPAFGGGVYVSSYGIFTMSGGAVSDNTAFAPSSWAQGGGVYVGGGIFSMSGGAVSGNTVSASSSLGGGVHVGGGIFSMSGGAVSGNTSSRNGGGVFVTDGGTFSMSGGTVSGNLLSGAGSYGREVLLYAGTFKMSGNAGPERVFLDLPGDTSQFITISGPLNGGAVPIDLRDTSSGLTGWAGKQILQLDGSYSSGNLANLKDYFTLGNYLSYYTETPITGYKIDDGGYLVAE